VAATTPRGWMSAARDALRSQLWPVPVLGVLLAIVLGIALPEVDDRLVHRLPEALTHYLFRGGPDAGRGVLAAVAGSLITVTSLTFSLTVVTLQLASSQHSPRVLRTFTQDRVVHLTLAVLLGTFTYTLSVMRAVRTDFDDREPFVPQLSVTVAYLLALASVITLVVFLAHLARKIRVESILRDVHAETGRTLHRLAAAPSPAPQPATEPGPRAATVCAPASGFLTAVDEKALLAAASDADAVIHVHRQPGESVIGGTPSPTSGPPGTTHWTATAVIASRNVCTAACAPRSNALRNRIWRTACGRSSTSRCGRCRPVSTTPPPRSTPSATPPHCCARPPGTPSAHGC
jgi:uncharacterized membrane protein